MTAQTPTQLTCDDARDLLPAYALGILEPDEQAVVHEHLDACADCRRALARFEGASDALATVPAPVPPPPALRARLLDSIQATPGAAALPAKTQPIPVPSQRSNIIAIPRWVIWPIAAAAILLIAGIATLAMLLGDARGDRDEARTASSQLASYLSAGGQVTKLSAATSDGHYYGHGSLVTAPEHPPLIIVGGCSPTSDERVYRVWVARGENRTRVGELKVSGDGDGWIEVSLGETLDSYDSIGITMVTNETERQDVLVAEVAPSVAS